MSLETDRIYLTDCIEGLRNLRDNCIDSIVTDPPYGLNFMGKEWDRLGDTSANYTNLNRPHESQENYAMKKSRRRPISETDGRAQQLFHYQWAVEVFRVLKPGGFLLAFGGSRTYHRMACAIEDAGFEIRDSISWMYGSGFPKSLDISKAIDKMYGAEREVVGRGKAGAAFHYGNPGEGGFGNTFDKDAGVASTEWNVTTAATEEAKKWDGWGTALKPAQEPIVVARKPLEESTVAKNVLKFGTGGINIDASRIAPTGERLGGGGEKKATFAGKEGWGRPWMEDEQAVASHTDKVVRNVEKATELGRWPANIIHDGSEEVVNLFPVTTSGAMKKEVPAYEGESNTGFLRGRSGPSNQHGDSDSASRFFQKCEFTEDDLISFYCSKASKKERGEFNTHPTVKPLTLMKYLVKLVTPPEGICIDPFSGSGTTLLACKLQGFKFIGFEKDEESFEIANRRLNEA